jgi:tetratricopeptide (TPR) repeat protein
MSKDQIRAQRLLTQGKMEEALPILEKNIKKKPKDAENWALLGFIHGDLHNYDRAESCLRNSLRLAPNTHYTYRVYHALGSLLERRGQHSEAITHYTKALEFNQNQVVIYINLGNCYKHKRCMVEAINAYRQALTIEPANYLACRNIGQLYEQSCQLEDARKYAELALKYMPKDVESHFLIAKLDWREKNYQQARHRLNDVLKMNMPSQHRAMVTKELGRLLDKMGQYEEAFEKLVDANQRFEAVYKEHKDESGIVEFRAEIDTYRDIFCREMTASWSGVDSFPKKLKIVFLVGFPRSGTTLTEQIMESHPEFIATHEVPVLPRLIREISEVVDRSFNYPMDMATLSEPEVIMLREAYMQRMSESLNLTIDANKFLLDKLPLNIIHLGFISRLFPEARILLAVRDPRDVCLSCFSQTFTYNQAMRQFLDINDTAKFYAVVMKLWFHYKKVLDINVIETRYEDIIDNLESAARRILEFVGADWNDEVLKYYESAKNRHVFTPSYQGVTQPVYRDSIAKWRNYEQDLTSVMPVLEPYIREFGYDTEN